MAGNNTLFPHETLELKDLLSSDLIIAKTLSKDIHGTRWRVESLHRKMPSTKRFY